jgi:hypothetical protein
MVYPVGSRGSGVGRWEGELGLWVRLEGLVILGSAIGKLCRLPEAPNRITQALPAFP